MKKFVRANVVITAVLLLMSSATSERMQPFSKSPVAMSPVAKSAAIPDFDLMALQFPGLISEEGKNKMEDYGYLLGAETALEPIHLAPSGYITAQYDARFALQSPVPEPETYAMLLAGAGILGLRRRFQKITTSPS